MGGLSVMKMNQSSAISESHPRVHKILIISNYILLSAASSCIFLTLSLRLFPSLRGFFLVILHISTILAAVSGCSLAISGSNKWFTAHMIGTSLTAIFQGSISILIFSQTTDFLGYLKSYVREENGAVILKLAGGLGFVIFSLEWLVLLLAFKLRYYAFVEGDAPAASSTTSANSRNGKVHDQEEFKNYLSYTLPV